MLLLYKKRVKVIDYLGYEMKITVRYNKRYARVTSQYGSEKNVRTYKSNVNWIDYDDFVFFVELVSASSKVNKVIHYIDSSYSEEYISKSSFRDSIILDNLIEKSRKKNKIKKILKESK